MAKINVLAFGNECSMLFRARLVELIKLLNNYYADVDIKVGTSNPYICTHYTHLDILNNREGNDYDNNSLDLYNLQHTNELDEAISWSSRLIVLGVPEKVKELSILNYACQMTQKCHKKIHLFSFNIVSERTNQQTDNEIRSILELSDTCICNHISSLEYFQKIGMPGSTEFLYEEDLACHAASELLKNLTPFTENQICICSDQQLSPRLQICTKNLINRLAASNRDKEIKIIMNNSTLISQDYSFLNGLDSNVIIVDYSTIDIYETMEECCQSVVCIAYGIPAVAMQTIVNGRNIALIDDTDEYHIYSKLFRRMRTDEAEIKKRVIKWDGTIDASTCHHQLSKAKTDYNSLESVFFTYLERL